MNARQYFCVFWCSTMWYLIYLIWEEEDFLCLGCLHTDLFACFFSWLLFKSVYPKQTCGSFASHSIFPKIELFPHSGEQNLCAIFHGTVMHQWKLREDTFLLHIGEKNLVVRLRASCGMEGEGTVFLFFLPAWPAVWAVAVCCWVAAGQQHKALSGLQATGMKDGSGGKSCH